MITFISGGARSGKSSFAEAFVLQKAEAPLYAATSSRSDEEMAARIEKHIIDRSSRFETVEVEYELEKMFRETEDKRVILIDCLTVWLNEAMFKKQQSASELLKQLERWCEMIEKKELDVTFVSNDINEGGIPDDPLTRGYVQALELLHRRLIEAAENVIQVRAGVPRVWKGAC